MSNFKIVNSRPFLWQGQFYEIVDMGMVEGIAYAKVSPENKRLKEELEKRIQRDFELKVYDGNSCIYFVEDHYKVRYNT